jgi:hypothetical protein
MISQKRLKELLHYDPETGIFVWRVSGTGRRPSRQAGTRKSNGRIEIGIEGRTYYAHRLAWLYTYGVWPNELDHINLETGDNRLGNLRKATRCENTYNIKRKSNNSSGFKGVSLHEGRWRARIQANKRAIFLGHFATKEQAIVAYREAAHRLHGEIVRVF